MAAPFRLGTALRAAWLVAEKDLRIEMRTREVLTTTVFFAILVTIMTSFAFAVGIDTRTRVAPGAIWLPTAFASVLAIGRTWQREREDQAWLGLLVSPAPRVSLFLGKALSTFLFVVAIELFVVPVVALLFHVDLPESGAGIFVFQILGALGVAFTGTLFGVMTVRTRARELILGSVLFPLLLPSLISGVSATRELLLGTPLLELTDYFELLGAFAIFSLVLGCALFGPLVDE